MLFYFIYSKYFSIKRFIKSILKRGRPRLLVNFIPLLVYEHHHQHISIHFLNMYRRTDPPEFATLLLYFYLFKISALAHKRFIETGQAPIAEWYKVLSLTTRCLSQLPRVESDTVPVTWCNAAVSPGYFSFIHYY